MAPGTCIVNPACSEDPKGFIDTCMTPALVDPRVYVSYQAVVDMGRLFGLADPEEHIALAERLAKAEDRITELEDQLADADHYAEAAEYTLRATFGQDTKIKSKPGPKPAARKP